MICHVNAFCNLRPVYEHIAPLKLTGSQERNQNFARGTVECGPIVEKFCSKNVSLGGVLSKLVQLKYITEGGVGARPAAAGQFL